MRDIIDRAFSSKYLRLGISLLIFSFCFIYSQQLSGQEKVSSDTTKAAISYNKSSDIQLSSDTIEQHTDSSPLDIADDRGLFILSPDHLMQMRILGSVRALFNFSDKDQGNNLSFNPYEIQTTGDIKSPIFYAGLSETRLGFEVTRRTKRLGDIFIRIEGDFANSVNSFRIRHAYGQMNKFLVGQTWSLFSNISLQPATVSFDGVVGAASLRTPQLRYLSTVGKKILWAIAIEYSNPDFYIPDSVNISLLQVIPDLTGRVSYKKDKFSCQVSSVISTISGRDSTNTITYSFGFGVSFAGFYTFNKTNKLYFSLTSGKAISHFMSIFSGKQEDAAYDPRAQKIDGLVSSGGYLAYDREFPYDLSANLAFGLAAITNKAYQLPSDYSYSYTAMLNVFWQPVDGARLGMEYAFGQRHDKGGSIGNGNRVSMLIYYDF